MSTVTIPIKYSYLSNHTPGAVACTPGKVMMSTDLKHSRTSRTCLVNQFRGRTGVAAPGG